MSTHEYADAHSRREPRRYPLVGYDDIDIVTAVTQTYLISAAELSAAEQLPELGSFRPLLVALRLLMAVERGRDLYGRRLFQAIQDSVGLSVIQEAIDAKAKPKEQPLALPEEGMPEPEDLNDAPSAFVVALIMAIVMDARIFLAGDRSFNGRLTVSTALLTVVVRDVPEYLSESVSSGVIALDATADGQAWKSVFPYSSIKVVGDEPVAIPPQVRITQFCDFFRGHQTMSRGHQRLARDLETVRRLMHSCPGPYALITFKANEKACGRALAGLDLKLMHFGALRGVNSLEGVRTLFVLGNPSPNELGLLRTLRGFYADEPEFDLTVDMRPERYVTSGTHYAWEVPVRRYKDPRLDSAFSRLGVGELIQAFHRARPLSRTDQLDVFILTERPIPGLPVHATGIGGVYCPELSEETSKVIAASLKLKAERGAAGQHSVDPSDIAKLAYGSSDGETRRAVSRGCMPDEICEHAGMTVKLGPRSSLRYSFIS